MVGGCRLYYICGRPLRIGAYEEKGKGDTGMSYMNVPNRIAEKYSKMTKAEKRIADYFMKQSGNLQLVSIIHNHIRLRLFP